MMPRPCGTWATPSRATARGDLRAMERPANEMCPVLRTSPEIARNVVLPAPFAPESARLEPPSATPCSALVPVRAWTSSSSEGAASRRLRCRCGTPR